MNAVWIVPMRECHESCSSAQRKLSTPMQGTAADIIKRAMIEVDSWLQSSRVPARLIMQVHDELVLEVSAGAIETVVGQIRTHMVRASDLSIPLKVDVGVGRNWDEAH